MTPQEREKLVDEIKFTIAIGVARGFNYPYIAEQVIDIAERAFAKDIEAAYKEGWSEGLITPFKTVSNIRSPDQCWKESRARAALEGVTEPASPWRDIESAPKDGTKILAFARGHTDYYGVAEWAEADSNLNRPIGVWIWDFLIRPTHWVPLSEPPR